MKGLDDDCGSLLGWILMRKIFCDEWVWFAVVKGCIVVVCRVFRASGFGVAKHVIAGFFSILESKFQKKLQNFISIA